MRLASEPGGGAEHLRGPQYRVVPQLGRARLIVNDRAKFVAFDLRQLVSVLSSISCRDADALSKLDNERSPVVSREPRRVPPPSSADMHCPHDLH